MYNMLSNTVDDFGILFYGIQNANYFSFPVNVINKLLCKEVFLCKNKYHIPIKNVFKLNLLIYNEIDLIVEDRVNTRSNKAC